MDMGEERTGDCRVPFIYGLFFIFILTGGIILTMWLIDAKGSQPWFPILALILIGFPWIFWLFGYLYSLIRKCILRGGGGGGGEGYGPRVNSARTNANTDHASPRGSNSSERKRQVQIGGPVVVVNGDRNGRGTHERESELPLAYSVAS